MNVELRLLDRRQWWKAVAIGVGTGMILAGLNVVALKTHVSPLPKPLALAFADTIAGARLPLPVGLLFHLAWVTFFSVVYVVLFRNELTLKNAFWLAAALWLVTLVVFFPIVGWGIFGLAAGPRLIAPVTVSHILFALILWGLCRAAFGESASRSPSRVTVP
jgi:hypothetical protein